MEKKRLLALLLILSSCTLPVKEKPKITPQKEGKSEQTERLKPVKFNPDASYYYMLYLNYLSQGKNGEALKAIEKAYQLDRKNTELAIEGARLAASLRKFEEADKLLSEVLKKEPKNVKALKLEAGICIAQGNLKRAEKLYRKVLNLKKDRDTYVFLSNLLINENKADEAIKILREGKKQFKNDYLLDYFMGQAYFIKKDYRRAREYLERSISENPDFESAYLLLGKTYQQLKQFSKAEKFLSAVLKKDPDNIYALRELLVIYIAENKPKKALNTINKLVSLEPYNLKLLSWVAANLFQMKEYREVIPIIERISKLNPNNPNVYFMLGLAYELSGNLEKAVEAYRKSLSYYQQNPTVMERLATVYFRMKNYEKARELYERLWGLTGNPDYLIKAAILEDKLGKTEEAYRLLSLWKEQLKNNPDYLFYLAFFADKLGKDRVAEKSLNELLKIKPTADIYNYLAYFYALRGKKLEKALNLIDKALKSNPNSAAYLDTKGWILFKMGKYSEACRYLKLAVEKEPNDAVINYHYGMCLLKSNRLKDASLHLEKAQKLVEKNPDVESEEPGIGEKVKKALQLLKQKEGGER